MALHFVSTSVLTSEDGIQFSKEVQLESEETKKVRLDQERAANKPLFMQLAERNELKQQEYDNVKKLIFAPPKGLDEEEYEFLSTLEAKKQRAEEDKKSLEDKEIEQFKAISKTNKQLPDISSSSSNTFSANRQQQLIDSESNTEVQRKAIQQQQQVSAPPIMIVRKRKKDITSDNTSSSNKNVTKKSSVESNTHNNKLQVNTIETSRTVTTSTANNINSKNNDVKPLSNNNNNNNVLSLVGDYPSDDDDE